MSRRRWCSAPPRRPAHLRYRRADPARPQRQSHEAAGAAAQDAVDGGIRPAGDRLSGNLGEAMAIDYIAPDFDGADLRIGIVQARFNEWAGRALFEACVAELVTLGVDEDDITHLTVPGCARGSGRAGEARRDRGLRRADRARLRDPRRDLSLRGRLRTSRRAVSPRSRSTTASRSPTASSPPKTTSRRAPASPKRARTQRAWRSKWPTCCGRWTKMATKPPGSEPHRGASARERRPQCPAARARTGGAGPLSVAGRRPGRRGH